MYKQTLLPLLAVILASNVGAATVIMRDGERYEGDVEEDTASELKLRVTKGSISNVVSLKRSDVAQIKTFTPNPEVEKKAAELIKDVEAAMKSKHADEAAAAWTELAEFYDKHEGYEEKAKAARKNAAVFTESNSAETNSASFTDKVFISASPSNVTVSAPSIVRRDPVNPTKPPVNSNMRRQKPDDLPAQQDSTWPRLFYLPQSQPQSREEFFDRERDAAVARLRGTFQTPALDSVNSNVQCPNYNDNTSSATFYNSSNHHYSHAGNCWPQRYTYILQPRDPLVLSYNRSSYTSYTYSTGTECHRPGGYTPTNGGYTPNPPANQWNVPRTSPPNYNANPPSTPSTGGGNTTHGNNGVGNGVDPQPPGNPRINDGAGTGPGHPGRKK